MAGKIRAQDESLGIGVGGGGHSGTGSCDGGARWGLLHRKNLVKEDINLLREGEHRLLRGNVLGFQLD
jgi:hypothetical protein